MTSVTTLNLAAEHQVFVPLHVVGVNVVEVVADRSQSLVVIPRLRLRQVVRTKGALDSFRHLLKYQERKEV